MDLKTEYRFEADAEAVFAMFSDPEYQRQKLVDAGHTHVEVVERGRRRTGEFRIVTRRTVAVDVPGVLKRVLSPTNTVTQTDEWAPAKKGVRTGTWKVDIKGIPIHLSGTMQLQRGQARRSSPFPGRRRRRCRSSAASSRSWRPATSTTRRPRSRTSAIAGSPARCEQVPPPVMAGSGALRH